MNARPRHCWRLLLGAAVAWSLAVAVPVAPNGVAAAGLPASVCPSSGRCSDPVLQQYRSGQPEPRVRTVPAAIQAGAFSNPDTYLPKLAAYLKGGSSDPFLQVKALHDWVAVNIAYDANAFFSGQLGSGDATQALKSHKAVCAGYSGLLKRLLDLAGFNNHEVSGYGRGWGSDALSAEHVSSNHAWTAVQIRGAW